MSEPDKSQQIEKQKPKGPEKNNTPTSPTKKATKIIFLSLFLLILCMVVAAILYQGQQALKDQHARFQELEIQMKEQATRFVNAKDRQAVALEQQKNQLATFNSNLGKQQQLLQQRLDVHSETLQALSGTNRTIWVVEEVRYLLRLAHQRQLMGDNAAGIVGLLQAAQTLLNNSDSPEIFVIRERIHEDILAVKLAPRVDRASLYLRLSAIASQINALPAVPLRTPPLNTAKNQSPSSATPSHLSADELPTWYQSAWLSITRAFQQVDQYVRIDTHDKRIQPLLSEHHQHVMETNMRLMLEQAQIALLREEPVIYRESLQKLMDWLTLHYQHFQQYSALIEEMSDLQKQTIVSEVPSIKQSLDLINEYIKKQHSLISDIQQ